MDIAKLQRVNQLARELKGFGIADSMDDAYSQADSMVDGGSELNFLKHLEDDPLAPETSPEVEQIHDNKERDQLKAQFLHLSSLYREQEAKMNNMADIMMKMQHAMNDLFSEIKDLKERPQAQPQVVVQQSAPRQEAPQQAPAQEEKKEEENHPRSGGYSAEDVSVDKIFYCGNK